MIRHCFFALLLLVAACNHADRYISGGHQPSERVSYPVNVPERMSWLEGSWKSPVLTTPVIEVLLHEDSIEVLDAQGRIQPFTWHDEELYYGAARQWKVTWVGKKDIRFDPVRAGAPAMTWTRQNANEWILIEHLKSGDKLTFFTRNTLVGLFTPRLSDLTSGRRNEGIPVNIEHRRMLCNAYLIMHKTWQAEV